MLGGAAFAAGGVPPAADAPLPHRRRLRHDRRAARPDQRLSAGTSPSRTEDAPRPPAARPGRAGCDSVSARASGPPRLTMSDTTEMTDHAWVREHIAAYVADGLSTDEAIRLEEHVRNCASAPRPGRSPPARSRPERALRAGAARCRTWKTSTRPEAPRRRPRPLACRWSGRGGLVESWPRRIVLIALGGIGAARAGGLPRRGRAADARASLVCIAEVQAASRTTMSHCRE